ncbi:MAG TPA: hypothetical protein EYG39_04180, partial [Rhodothermales bacterium]|nr:hypothetical protein [Rhodothermales bacterium]
MPSRAIPVPTSGATKRAVHRAQRSAARILATELDGLLVNGYDGPVPTAFPPGGGAGVDYFRQAKRLYAFVNAARAALVSIRGTTNVPLLDASAAVRPQHALSVTAVNRIIEEVSAALDDDPGEPPPANPKTAVLVGIGG